MPGQPPNLQNLPKGCAFSSRCEYCSERCLEEMPELSTKTDIRSVACHRENAA
ncbi:MAG: hypothetical protein R3261_08055 [Alphaproteobacteria bacterium]|nr:hypothetical protein [Alphaproteobacteria bacterium]